MDLSTFLIDLDETVYPVETGIWSAARSRMNQYMHDVLHFNWEEIPRIRERLFHEYGTTTRGLQVVYHIDVDEFLEYVHDLPIQQMLKPDPELGQVLRCYPQRKLVFTNATRKHAEKVLEVLGVRDCFEDIVDIYTIQPFCKPQVEAYQIAMRIAKEPVPQRCLFIDDTIKNVETAREMGFVTVRVGEPFSLAHYNITRLVDLPAVLPINGRGA
jgi:putative hydrolase of the HAD superfamily